MADVNKSVLWGCLLTGFSHFAIDWIVIIVYESYSYVLKNRGPETVFFPYKINDLW